VIYYLQTGSDRLLVTMYFKSDQADVPAVELRRIIQSEEEKPETG
jgi:hypothetical protein